VRPLGHSKRIHTIGRSRSSLDWEKARELAKEIDHLRTTIAGPLAERDARLAAERMWDLVGIADAVLTRIHGTAQAVVEAFEAAIACSRTLATTGSFPARCRRSRSWRRCTTGAHPSTIDSARSRSLLSH
jgi:uncharacterized protein DUF6880